SQLVPLTIAVWFLTTRGKRSIYFGIAGLASSILGPAMSKIVSAVVLAPFALSALMRPGSHLPRLAKVFTAIMMAGAAMGLIYLLARFGTFFLDLIKLGMTHIGPQSYEFFGTYGMSLQAALPYLARDCAILMMAAIAFRLMPWPAAASLALGAVTVL